MSDDNPFSEFGYATYGAGAPATPPVAAPIAPAAQEPAPAAAEPQAAPATPAGGDDNPFASMGYAQHSTEKEQAAESGKKPEPQMPDFFTRVGADLKKRGEKWNDISGQYQADPTIGNLALSTLAGTGKVVAGSVNDIVGEGAKSAWNSMPDFMTKPIEAGVKSGAQYLANTDLGKEGLAAAKQGIEKYQEWAKTNPRTAQALESTVDIASLFPTAKGIEGAATGLKAADDLVSSTMKGVTPNLAGNMGLAATKDYVVGGAKNMWQGRKSLTAPGMAQLEQDLEDLKDAGHSQFTAFRDNGAVLSDEKSQKVLQAMQSAATKDSKLKSYTAPKVIDALKDFEEDITDPAHGSGYGLDDLHQFRQNLNEIVRNGTNIKGEMDTDAFKAMQMRDALDKQVDGLTDKHLIAGTPDAVDALRAGQKQWSQMKKFSAIHSIVKNSDGDFKYLKRQLANFAARPKNTAGWSGDELAALKSASQASRPEAMMSVLGRFGVDLSPGRSAGIGGTAGLMEGLGLATGHGVDAGLSIAGATAARQGARYSAYGKAANLLNVLKGNAPGPYEPPPPAPPPTISGLLTGPTLSSNAPRTAVYASGPVISTSTEGHAIPMPDANREIIGQSPSTIAEGHGEIASPPIMPDAQAAAAAKTAPHFDAKAAADFAKKNADIKGMWKENGVPVDMMIEDAAQRMKDAGIKPGSLGEHLMDFLNNQKGELDPQRYKDLADGIANFGKKAAPYAGAAETQIKNNQVKKQQGSDASDVLPQVGSERRIAQAESNLDPNAKNPNSSASGLLQFTKGTWASMVRKYGKDTGITMADMNDPKAQAMFGHLLTEDNKASLRNSLGRDANMGEVYLAHVFGADRAAALSKAYGHGIPAARLVSPDAVAANRPLFYHNGRPRTVEELYAALAHRVKAAVGGRIIGNESTVSDPLQGSAGTGLGDGVMGAGNNSILNFNRGLGEVGGGLSGVATPSIPGLSSGRRKGSLQGSKKTGRAGMKLLHKPSATRFADGGVVKAAEIDHAPTELQKMAGNYKKDHITLHGLGITIENAKGSTRSGKDAGGKDWSVRMPAHYGYIKRTTGADGDHTDCYVGPDHDSDKAFIVDQIHHKTKKFDEHKVMLGFKTRSQALACYREAFSDGKGGDRIGHVRQCGIADLKNWLSEGRTTEPVKHQKVAAHV